MFGRIYCSLLLQRKRMVIYLAKLKKVKKKKKSTSKRLKSSSEVVWAAFMLLFCAFWSKEYLSLLRWPYNSESIFSRKYFFNVFSNILPGINLNMNYCDYFYKKFILKETFILNFNLAMKIAFDADLTLK